MAVYSYLFTDLKSGTILGDMPLHGVTFSRQMNKPGNFNGSCNLDNAWTENEDVKQYTTPGKTALYIYRDDQIVWGGIIWSRTYQAQAKSIQISAQTFESYAYRRIFSPSGVNYITMDQCVMVDYLWSGMQAIVNGSINVLGHIGAFPSGDIERERTVNPWDMNTYGEIIDGITNLEDGCDYTIDYFEENGRPLKRVMVGYPQLGNPIEISGMILDYPGCISNYYRTENSTESVNHTWATGDGEGYGLTTGSAYDADGLLSYPLLEGVNSYQGVTDQDTIDAHAASDLAAKPVGKQRFGLNLIGTEEPIFGSYGLGDDARVMIEDTWFSTGTEFPVRVVGWNVTPSSSDSVEEVTIVLEGGDTGAV